MKTGKPLTSASQQFVFQLLGGFGDAEVNDLRDGHAVVQGDKDIRGFSVAVYDPFLMRVLEGVTDFDEQIQAFTV